MIWLAVFVGGSVGVLITFWFFRWLCKDKNESNTFEADISDLTYASRPSHESNDDIVSASLFAVMAICSCDSSSSDDDWAGSNDCF